MNWLRRLLGLASRKAMPCPRCQAIGSEYRGPLVIPYDDGSRKRVGELYGCPHCGLAWFTQDGALRLFGHLKGTMNLHPQNWSPPADRVKAEERDDAPVRDADIPWRRR